MVIGRARSARLRARVCWAGLLSIAFGGLPMPLHAADAPALFSPPGMVTNDNWFARDGDTYHAFYLQVPRCMGDVNDWALRSLLAQIGHATSDDLVHWTDRGPVLVPIPGTWHSRLATGSVAPYDGKWWMVFTAHGTPPGIGLAVSDDLMEWELVGDGPVVPQQVYQGTWGDGTLDWIPLADPYLYPEPIEGWYYMVINSKATVGPDSENGCLSTMRSQDMLHWEPGPVLCYPRSVDRLETPQVWEHAGRWYLYFGAAHDQPQISANWAAEVPPELAERRRANCVYMAESFVGPYSPAPGQWWLDAMPDGRGGYIHKVLHGPDGGDVLITTTDGKLSPAYRVVYGEDGAVSLTSR